MKFRSRHNSTKKGFMISFLTVTLRPLIKYHAPHCFPSRNITKNAETHPPPMRDVIIVQPTEISLGAVVLFVSIGSMFQFCEALLT